MRDDLPSGTVTLLLTDIEGSTRLLNELGEGDAAAEAYREGLNLAAGPGLTAIPHLDAD